MKLATFLGLMLATVLSVVSLEANAAKKQVGKRTVKKAIQKNKSSDGTGANLSTDHNFNDSFVHGRYQTPIEANAKVENEKTLSDLLAVRTQFKDRLRKSAEQN